MGITEVTNGQYRKFKPSHSSMVYMGLSLNGDKQPVVFISRKDAVAFCSWLTSRERRAGKIGDGDVYQLPTEAKWEYACRARMKTSRFWGNDESLAKDYCNANDSVTKEKFGWRHDAFPGDDGYRVTAPVGKFKPNAFGLYDMHGNVYEWCKNWYGKYPKGTVTDPKGPRSGSYHVVRGGCWQSTPEACRSADRSISPPSRLSNYCGFRVVLARAAPRKR
jgi:formylglycine-generating enzyme required for sulfatase activity